MEKQNDSPVRLLILGGGGVVQHCFLPAASRCDGVKVTAIVEPSPHSTQQIRNTFPAVRVIPDPFERVLSDPNLKNLFDGVIVALPNELHEKAVILALQAGLPVLCEKPLTTSREGCRRIQEASLKTGVPVYVGMSRRHLPNFMALKLALAQVSLGKIEAIEIEDGGRYGWMPASSAPFHPQNGGVLMDIGVHYLDLITQLFGNLDPVSYTDDAVGGCEANVQYHLRTKKRVPVHLKLSRSHSLKNQFRIRGKEASLFFNKDEFDKCYWESNLTSEVRGQFAIPQRDPQALDFISGFTRELAEFRKVIVEKARPASTVKEAKHVIDLVEWAYRSRRHSTTEKTDKQKKKSSAAKAQTALITGAGGFIGNYLCEYLHQQGWKLKALSSRFASFAEVAKFPLEFVRADILDKAAMEKAFTGSRYIFHLAYSGDPKRLQSSVVEGTKNVVEAAIAAGAECVVIASTAYVFGFPKGKMVDESFPYQPHSAYGRAKAQAEKWCLERAKTSGKTRIVILNPTCVFGPGGYAYTQLPVQLAAGGNFCWIDGGVGMANVVFVKDLVEAMFLAAGAPEAHAQRYIVNGDSLTWKSFFSPILNPFSQTFPSFSAEALARMAAENRRRVSELPGAVIRSPEVRAVLRDLPGIQLLKRVVPMSRPNFASDGSQDIKRVYPEWLGTLYGNWDTRFSSNKIHQELGWIPRHSVEQGQEICRQWLSESSLYPQAANETPALKRRRG